MKNAHIRRAVMIERLKSHLVKNFNLHLKDVDKWLKDNVFNLSIDELSKTEVNQLLRSAEQELKHLFGVYVDDLKSQWLTLFNDSYRFETKAIIQHYQHLKDKIKPLEQNILSQMANQVLNKPLDFKGMTGITLGEMLESFPLSESKRIVRVIRLAHHQGKTMQDVIKSILGTKSRKYQDGVLNISKRNAETIVRTGTQVFNSEAKAKFMEQHDDLIDGIQIVATLDSRTSSVCRHLDREYMPLDRAIYPPFHFNCRSTFVYVLKGEKPSTDEMSYYEWLKQQDKSFIEQVLGKKQAQLFLSDGMTVEKFKQLHLDRVFTPMRLDELMADEINPKSMVQFTENIGNKIVRTDWGNFPNAMIAYTQNTITTHNQYSMAKSGDINSALALVDEFLSDEFVVGVKKAIHDYKDVHIVPVHAEERLGRNKIPMAYALALSEMLGVKMDLNIVQAERAYRTDSDGVGRLLKRVAFDGSVAVGRNYVIVDDVITQGGTLADLRAYIENKGGKVILVTTLNGKPNSAKMPITRATLGQLRKQAGRELEQWWQERFGYDFAKFTESEARYLTKQIHRYGIDTVRDKLFKARP